MNSRFDLSKVITILVLFVAAVAILYVVFTAAADKEQAGVMEVGKPAPDFTLQTPDGEEVSLSDYKGKVVMINFWASWCEPCRLETPELEKAYEAHKDQGFEILGVNLAENEVTVNGFIKNQGMTYPVVLDRDKSIAIDTYKVKPLPTSYFVDRDGILRVVAARPMTVRDIEGQINPLLSE